MKLAIVGIFFDGYIDIWRDFIALFKRFWPDCPFPLYIVGQQAKLEEHKDVRFLSAGENAEFSQKVRTAVDLIDADYYLLLLEDFFFSVRLTSNCLDDVLNYVIDKDINYCALPLKEFASAKAFNGKIIDATTKIREMPTSAEYTLSCQPSIWKRDFLSEIIGKENYNAWVFEGVYASAAESHAETFLKKCICQSSNVLNLKHGIVQGKMLPKTYKYLVEKADYSFLSNRVVLSGKDYRSYKTKVFFGKLLPKPIIKIVKKIFHRKGVLDRYKDEIIDVMNKMGLHEK